MKNFLFCALCFFIQETMLKAQSLPTIGSQMPDFELKDVRYFNMKKVSLADFKGKWLFLDFWFTGCTSCIQSFPKINELQEKFGDRAVFMLVGLNESQRNKGIENLYEKFRNRLNLNIPIAYDSMLASKWQISSMPHIYIVRPDGILHNISDGRDFTDINIRNLLHGDSVKMWTKNGDKVVPFDTKNLAHNDIFYQSMIAQWNGQSQYLYSKIEDAIPELKQGYGLKLTMVPLKFLYRWAYTGYSSWDVPQDSLYGKFYPDPILDIKDSSYFIYDYNKIEQKGKFNYSLMLPSGQVSVERIKQIVQNDLRNTFGYTISIEERDVPVLKLIIKDSKAANKLKTKGGSMKFDGGNDASGGAAGFKATNMTVDDFLINIVYYQWMGRPPYFNYTGITGNIDINFNAILTDWSDIIHELNNHGLDLVEGIKKMKCLVVKD